MENWRVSFPSLYDTSTSVTQSYMVYDLLGDGLATPSVFIVDAEGVIRWKYVGRDPGDRPSLSIIKNQLVGLTVVEVVPSPQPTASPETSITVGTDVGDSAPGFTLASTAGVDRSLESYRGDKNLVVVFYRAFW